MVEASTIKRLIDPIKRKVMLAIGRAIIKAVDDSKTVQSVQVALLADEVRDDVEHFQNYGFSSVPHPDAEGVIVFPGGSRSHGLLIAVEDRRYRLKGLTGGEVALYTDEGDYIKLKRGNVIEIHTPKATFSGNVEIAGNLKVSGTVTGEKTISATGNISSSAEVQDSKGTMASVRSTYNGHTHNETETVTNAPNQQMPV